MTGEKKEAQKLALSPGDMIVIGNKVYGVCTSCRAFVRINKPILGSAHVCN